MRLFKSSLLLFLLVLAALAGADEIREANLKLLSQKGFRVAPNLPTGRLSELRPQEEIELRMDALLSLVL